MDAAKARLIRSLRLFDIAASENAPEFLKRVDPVAIRDVFGGDDLPWGEEGLYPDTTVFVEELCKSEEGKKLFLSSGIELLDKVLAQATDVTHVGPFGLMETVFPVRVRGRIVHSVWSGKCRETPFTAAELAEVARLTGMSKRDAAELAACVPVMTPKDSERGLALCSRLRTALEAAISYHVRETEVTDQLVQSERTHSLGTLSGGVAHHFNNLLSVILGYSSYVLNREKISKDAADALHKITEAAQRGRRLTEEILAFLGSDTEEDVPCRVHETVNSVLSLLESKTGAAVRVEKNLDAENDVVLASPSSIRQIVFNMLTNAIDSMPSGGLLAIASLNTTMATEDGPQNYFRLEVSDSSGLLPEGVDRVGSGEAKRPSDRVGMKLSSVYGMVGRLDGTVVVSADPGTTTRVQILLPALQAGAKVEEERKVRRRLAPSAIWVVDDDAIFREMCRQVLSDEGHSVKEAGGGREFMEMWRRGGDKPDLIIMDFSMPEYNGLQLCEWLRDEGAKAPVILVSGFAASQPDIRKALKLRKTFFLQKPFSFREMTDTVTVALGETLIGE